jgi:hypothetical protein
VGLILEFLQLLHGFTGNSSDVRQLGRFLQKKGYTSYAPQYEGHAKKNGCGNLICIQNPSSIIISKLFLRYIFLFKYNKLNYHNRFSLRKGNEQSYFYMDLQVIHQT